LTELNSTNLTPRAWTSGDELLVINEGGGSPDTVARVNGSIPASMIANGKQTIFIPAGAMVARITNGPSDGIGETTTNRVMRRTMDFDATTAEFAQFAIAMPKSWNEGTITFQPLWSHAATTTNFGVVWTLAAVAHSDADALEAAFGPAISVTDTGGTTNTLYIGPESSAVTIAGTPAELDQITLQIGRLPTDGSDTMAIDARLHGVRVYYTATTGVDD
jgi:hypothetical protein